jgi:hypothetical protein
VTDRAATLASAILTLHLGCIRRAVSHGWLSQETGIAPALLAHLIDEISLGVLHQGLSAHLTYILRDAMLSRPELEPDPRHLAALATRTIARFLEDLRLVDSPVFHGGGRTDVLSASSNTVLRSSSAIAPQALYESPAQTLPSNGTEYAQAWCWSLGALIESNVAASQVLRTMIGSDRQLGELLAELSSNPTEVET